MPDGTDDFSAGVDSGQVSTIRGSLNPTGLMRNQLFWAGNSTMRGGGVGQRTAWQPLLETPPWTGNFQCGFMYQPTNGDPYMVLSVGGRIYTYDIVQNILVDQSAVFGLTNPDTELGHMCQGEEFLIIQAGDGVTLPLFWDGSTLRRSNGFLGIGNVPPALPPYNELPAAGPMEYFMGRLWYAFGRQYTAGDIVGSAASGSAPYGYRDSILKCTENPLSLAGDAFIVPTSAGDIRALKYAGNANTQLGSTTSGTLYVFTREQIYSCDVPVTRAAWSTLSEPFQRVVQMNYGATSDRGVVRVNGDLFYRAVDGIRSLRVAVRDTNMWGDVPLSRNEQRVLQFDDRSLLRWASGIYFNNRLLETCLPAHGDQGVYHQGIIPLDFDLISSIGERLPPAWEGVWSGLNCMQLLEADFGGRQRAFSVVQSSLTGVIQLWELTSDQRFENNDDRVEWFLESPSYTWGDPMARKQLDGMELWVDKIFGTVNFELYYMADQSPCPVFWNQWEACAARNCQEDLSITGCPAYPTNDYREQFRNFVMPTPPAECMTPNSRPSNVGFQFRILLKVVGWARVRGWRLYAIPKPLAPFEGVNCSA